MEEIEVKILEINEAVIRARLDAFAEKTIEARLMKTVTFTNPYNNALVRVRLSDGETTFTVKVPVPDGTYKVRQEYETVVGDLETFCRQMEILGFKPAMVQEKRRTAYKYGDVEIVIDQYPRIPSYVEIEGPRSGILTVLQKLGYTLDDTTPASVYSLFKHYGVDGTELLFE